MVKLSYLLHKYRGNTALPFWLFYAIMLFTVAVFSIRSFECCVSSRSVKFPNVTSFFCFFSVQNAIILLLHYRINTSTADDVFSHPAIWCYLFLTELVGKMGNGPRKILLWSQEGPRNFNLKRLLDLGIGLCAIGCHSSWQNGQQNKNICSLTFAMLYRFLFFIRANKIFWMSCLFVITEQAIRRSMDGFSLQLQ